MKYILHDEGRIVVNQSSATYEYHLKDHLGNTRVAFQEGGSKPIQSTAYYPFGLTMNMSEGSTNKYLYNGKEKQELTDWLDYGARFYDAQLGCFFTQDRFAESFYNESCYQYVSNNPMIHIDYNGDYKVKVRKFTSMNPQVQADLNYANMVTYRVTVQNADRLETLDKFSSIPVIGSVFLGAKIAFSEIENDPSFSYSNGDKFGMFAAAFTGGLSSIIKRTAGYIDDLGEGLLSVNSEIVNSGSFAFENDYSKLWQEFGMVCDFSRSGVGNLTYEKDGTTITGLAFSDKFINGIQSEFLNVEKDMSADDVQNMTKEYLIDFINNYLNSKNEEEEKK